jgi:hypothetical protein
MQITVDTMLANYYNAAPENTYQSNGFLDWQELSTGGGSSQVTKV